MDLNKNNMFFNEKFVIKLFKLIPKNLKKIWEFEIIDYSKVSGYVRYNNDNLDSIYLEIKILFDKNLIKFNLINNKFIFDSTYSQYDPLTKKYMYPYENRYDKKLNIVARYKFNTEFDFNLDKSVLSVQYKDGKKLKKYYRSVDKFP